MNNEFKLIGTVTKKPECRFKDWDVFYNGKDVRVDAVDMRSENGFGYPVEHYTDELQTLANNLVAEYNIKQLLSKEGWVSFGKDDAVMSRKTHKGEVFFDVPARGLTYDMEDICLTFCNDLSPEKIVSQINNIIGDTNWAPLPVVYTGGRYLGVPSEWSSCVVGIRESDGRIVWANRESIWFTPDIGQWNNPVFDGDYLVDSFRMNVLRLMKESSVLEPSNHDIKGIVEFLTGAKFIGVDKGIVWVEKYGRFGYTCTTSLVNAYDTYTATPVSLLRTDCYMTPNTWINTWLKDNGYIKPVVIEIGSFQGLSETITVVLVNEDILYQYGSDGELYELGNLTESSINKASKVIAKYIQDNVKV